MDPALPAPGAIELLILSPLTELLTKRLWFTVEWSPDLGSIDDCADRCAD